MAHWAKTCGNFSPFGEEQQPYGWCWFMERYQGLEDSANTVAIEGRHHGGGDFTPMWS